MLRTLLLMVVLVSFAVVSQSACGGGGGGGGAVDATPGTGNVPFMETCDINTNDCDSSSFCFEFGEGAVVCTRQCTRDEECSSPSRGCNNKGVCKRP